jgi:hypothetical protein
MAHKNIKIKNGCRNQEKLKLQRQKKNKEGKEID